MLGVDAAPVAPPCPRCGAPVAEDLGVRADARRFAFAVVRQWRCLNGHATTWNPSGVPRWRWLGRCDVCGHLVLDLRWEYHTATRHPACRPEHERQRKRRWWRRKDA